MKQVYVTQINKEIDERALMNFSTALMLFEE